jgi:uncharacterized repeat protein (TIGR01451 family)
MTLGGAVGASTSEQTSATTQAPSQEGIARKYPGDTGIENDSQVIFTEDFETGSLSDITDRWTDHSNVEGMSLVSDVPSASSGARSLQITSIGGTNTGGHFYKRLSIGHDQLYFRFYVKYASGGTYHHTGGKIGGYNPPTNWPQGGAGIRPSGNDRFTIGAEPVGQDPWRFDFYVYWMHMRGNPGDDRYWGNDFIQDPTLHFTDKWTCVEVMVKLNNPVSSYNGELALWIDGEQIIHLGEGFPNGRWVWDSFYPDPAGSPFEGFQWRNAEELEINWIWLLHYVTQDPPGYVGKVWFDDVVLATSYIGPIDAPTGLTKTPHATEIAPGDAITYSLAYANATTATASTAFITDDIPGFTSFIACAGGQSCGLAGDAVTWDLGDVPASSGGVVTLTLRASGTAIPGVVITNTAVFSSPAASAPAVATAEVRVGGWPHNLYLPLVLKEQ